MSKGKKKWARAAAAKAAKAAKVAEAAKEAIGHPNGHVVIVLPTYVRKDELAKLHAFEEEKDSLFNEFHEMQKECEEYVTKLVSSVLTVYSIVGGGAILQGLSCKAAALNSGLMIGVLLLGLVLPVVTTIIGFRGRKSAINLLKRRGNKFETRMAAFHASVNNLNDHAHANVGPMDEPRTEEFNERLEATLVLDNLEFMDNQWQSVWITIILAIIMAVLLPYLAYMMNCYGSDVSSGLSSSSGGFRLVADAATTCHLPIPKVGEGAFEVLSTSGDTHLGGDDFDKRVVDWLAENFKRDEGIDLLKDKQALQRLTETAEKAKMELSSLTQTNISLPFITATADGPKHIETTLTRAKFEELCSDLLDRLKTPVQNSPRDAKLSFSDLDGVILVGGSTRIPAVQEDVNKLTGKDPNVTVNPDEVVALGAAVQAGILAGEVSDIVLLDVTPLSLGLETLGGVMTKIITRNTTLPTSKSEVFSTAADGQTSVEINVLQGEREFVRDNKSLGSFRLDGIPPAPRGVPQIEVKFDIDANGILSVTAIDKGSGKKQDITITGASTLPSDEVDRMVKEAEKFSKEDKEKRDAIDTKNQADSVVYQTEKQLKEFGDKVPAAVKEQVEAKVGELKDAISGGSTQAIKDAMAALNQEVMKLGSSVYGKPGEAADTGGAPGTDAGPSGKAADKGTDEDVIDADFTDSK